MKQNSTTGTTILTKSVSLTTTSKRFGFGRNFVISSIPQDTFDGLEMAVITPDPDGGEPQFTRTAYVPRPSLTLPSDPATLASFSRGDVVVHARKPQV